MADRDGTTFGVAATKHGEHGEDGGNGQADHVDILPRGLQRRTAHAADKEEGGGASRRGRDLKKQKKKDQDPRQEVKNSEAGAGTQFVGAGKKVSCKKSPEHPDCRTPLVITPAPTPAPTACQPTSFTTCNPDYDGTETKFSFTNEMDFQFNCNDLTKSIANNGAIESVMVAYQNNLLMQYGVDDEITYGAAAVTSFCIMGDTAEDGCIDNIEEICGSETDRRLQTSSVNSATIR